jgi:hypothetical protein
MLIQGSAFQFLSQRDGNGDRWGITCCATLCRHIYRYALRFSVFIVFIVFILDRDADVWSEWTSIHSTDTAQWRYVTKKSHVEQRTYIHAVTQSTTVLLATSPGDRRRASSMPIIQMTLRTGVIGTGRLQQARQ